MLPWEFKGDLSAVSRRQGDRHGVRTQIARSAPLLIALTSHAGQGIQCGSRPAETVNRTDRSDVDPLRDVAVLLQLHIMAQANPPMGETAEQSGCDPDTASVCVCVCVCDH